MSSSTRSACCTINGSIYESPAWARQCLDNQLSRNTLCGPETSMLSVTYSSLLNGIVLNLLNILEY